MKLIDLRSDTVTWPTLEMREAMANAVVGDDVIGDDPTVIQLEQDAAKITGKEAALFVSSGTLGNILAILCHCQLGDEVILGQESHIFCHETAGISAIAGVMPHCITEQSDGTLKLEDIKNAVRDVDDHHPITKLIIIENTHNRRGGVTLPKTYIDSVGAFAHSNHLKLHIDGARIFNAATALNIDIKELIASADSISFCLSKGLCAPMGSILCGTKQFIQKARHKRKMLGGGLRQSGIMASAGLIALNKMSKRLDEDHKVAKMLYEGLKDIPGIKVLSCYTNFVWFELTLPVPPATFAKDMEKFGIILDCYSRRVRCAIHYWITPDKIKIIVDAFKHVSQKYNNSKL